MTEQPELDRARGEAADVADCEVPLLQPANTDGEHRARPSSFRGSRLVWFIISLVCVFLLNICISQVRESPDTSTVSTRAAESLPSPGHYY